MVKSYLNLFPKSTPFRSVAITPGNQFKAFERISRNRIKWLRWFYHKGCIECDRSIYLSLIDLPVPLHLHYLTSTYTFCYYHTSTFWWLRL